MRLGFRRRLPMKTVMTRKGVGGAVVLAALGLAGCSIFGSYERAVERTRADLLGLSGRDLRHCLGVPTDFDRDDDDGIELLTYRWVFKPKEPMGVTTGVGSGGIGGIVIGRRDGGGGYDPMGFPRDPMEQSVCQIVFTLQKDAVTQVTAHGENDVGAQQDGRCLMRAQRCVDVRDEDDAAE
jgi:hypothetical protein